MIKFCNKYLRLIAMENIKHPAFAVWALFNALLIKVEKILKGPITFTFNKISNYGQESFLGV